MKSQEFITEFRGAVMNILRRELPDQEQEKDRARLKHAIELVKSKGMENLPPIIMLQHANGLELVEGWHRIMAAFRLHPEGFRINAWIGVAT